MNLDEVVAALRTGAEIRCLCQDDSDETAYHVIRVLAPIPPILISDMQTRGLLDPAESRWRYTLIRDAPQ